MILITGGSGFIGGHFNTALSYLNDNVINLDMVNPPFRTNQIFLKGDIRNQQDVTKAIEGRGIKTIISLAAKHHDFGIGHDEYFDTNEEGTKILCRIAAINDIKAIIFFSSVAVYGLRKDVSTEEMDPSPDSPYGASKLAGENVLRQWAAENNERCVVIIRPTLVFGPNNMANMRNLIRQIDSGLYFHLGKADNIKSIAYVENIVQATLFLMKRMKPGVDVYNYADEPQLSTREISNIIADHLNKKIRVTLPRELGILLGLPFDILIKLTGKNLPISTARIKKLSTATHHSAKKLFRVGFVPKFTTYDGLRMMVNWYQQGNSQ